MPCFVCSSLGCEAALASGNVVFLRFAGPIPLPDCPVTGQDLGIMTLLVSYLIGVLDGLIH